MLYRAKCTNPQTARDTIVAWNKMHTDYYNDRHPPLPQQDIRPGALFRELGLLKKNASMYALGYTTAGNIHQWLAISAVVQIWLFPDETILLRLEGQRHSIAAIAAETDGSLRRLVESSVEILTYKTTQPTWGPLDTLDIHT